MFEKNNKKKYQCFVCGRQFEDFEEFKEHIKSEHEEGRDYVKCPINHCGAPVRDLRTHFKCKHPKLEIPKCIKQYKAIIWRDFKNGEKKTRKPKFREGYFFSTKMNKNIHYRSGYECKVYELLEQDDQVLAYGEEPFEIPYIYKGKKRKYIPDIIVRYHDGRVEVWEVKPADQTSLEVNVCKWESAETSCRMRGWKFVVITEIGMENLKRKINESRRK